MLGTVFNSGATVEKYGPGSCPLVSFPAVVFRDIDPHPSLSPVRPDSLCGVDPGHWGSRKAFQVTEVQPGWRTPRLGTVATFLGVWSLECSKQDLVRKANSQAPAPTGTRNSRSRAQRPVLKGWAGLKRIHLRTTALDQ